MMDVTLFLFHRDLRLADNTALAAAVALGRPVLPAFVFDPAQCDPAATVAANERANAYYSHPAVQFMCESLVSLDAELRALGSQLWLFRGDTVDVLKRLAAARRGPRIRAVAYNEDHTVFAQKRDAAVAEWARGAGVDMCTREDYGLMPMADCMLGGPGEAPRPYMVLSAFYKRFLKTVKVRAVDRTVIARGGLVAAGAGPAVAASMAVRAADIAPDRARFYTPLPALAVHGGRKEALSTLERARDIAKHYAARRDIPGVAGTTRASPHLRFGTMSVRELYWAIGGGDSPLVRELVFREFYAKIYAARPALQRGEALLADLDKALPWVYGASERERLAAWAEARTGYPLVDAGMRELVATGWQHNRVRMLCASVLTKYFMVDWRRGLQFYYRHLEDADAFSNTAGWGFSSSTGPDAVPYFRAPFNPFIQSKKFDADAAYIKRWLPELADVAPADIHRWDDARVRARYDVAYPPPLIPPKEASAAAVAAYRAAARHSK